MGCADIRPRIVGDYTGRPTIGIGNKSVEQAS